MNSGILVLPFFVLLVFSVLVNLGDFIVVVCPIAVKEQGCKKKTDAQ